jgi:tetratricopeptide (TPR) repeat protein
MRRKLGKLCSTVVLFIGLPNLLFAGEAIDAFNEGVKFYRAGKFKEAIAAYDRAIKAAPNAAEAYLGRPSSDSRMGPSRITMRRLD